MLSPGYLNFMRTSVGIILSGAAFGRITPTESNHLIMVALYLSRDAEARELFLEGLQDYGNFVCHMWEHAYDEVMKCNREGSERATGHVEQILERMRKR